MSAIGMPNHLLAYFQSRPPLDYLPPNKKHKMPSYQGMAMCVQHFEETPPPPVIPYETPKERRMRLKQETLKKHEEERKAKIQIYRNRSTNTPFHSKNALSTLFVGRLSYETTEKRLRKEFELYGPIKMIRILYDWNGKPKGYGFIEYENEYDMRETYKKMDGKKVDGWRVVVDVERNRTVRDWLPRFLGGGEGAQRCAAKKNGTTSSTPMLTNAPYSHTARDSHRSSGYPDRNTEYDRRKPTGYDRDFDRHRRRSPARDRRPKEYTRKRSRSRSRSRSRGRPRDRRRDY